MEVGVAVRRGSGPDCRHDELVQFVKTSVMTEVVARGSIN
jgi:hypothetical protein